MSSRKPPAAPGQGNLIDDDRHWGERVAGPAAGVAEFAGWIGAAIRRADLSEARERLARARGRWPAVDWTALEVEILTMGRDYRKASVAIATALAAARNAPEAAFLAELKAEMDAMDAIATRIAGRDRQQSPNDLTVYAINLDENPDRWDRISRLTRPRPLRRVAGVPGRYLADGLMQRFGAQVSASFKGTLGCFLAHYAAWEAHLKSGEAHALILEDDCLPLVDIPASAAALELPEAFDICFLTTALGRVAAADLPPHGTLLHRPLRDVIRALAPHLEAPGGYGYVVSRRGAERLVERADADGFYGDVDWRMIACCLTEDDLVQLPPESFARAAVAPHLQLAGPRKPLAGYACQPGLVRPGRLGSVRERDNSFRHVHLWRTADSPR